MGSTTQHTFCCRILSRRYSCKHDSSLSKTSKYACVSAFASGGLRTTSAYAVSGLARPFSSPLLASD